MDESRKQFEEWFSDQGRHPYAIEKSNGNYILASANSAWQSWQASRAAIEVDLAPANLLKCDGRDVVEILKYHGIKVKE
ncbi:hypothetical protein ACUADT_001075 [Enterobacter cloacae]